MDDASRPPPRRRERSRASLVRTLQGAHAGEWGAIRAYLGHRRSLRAGRDREMIVRILKDEIHHRRRIGEMLDALGAAPDPSRERRMDRIGRFIAWICRWTGTFVPMYGAARLESANIVEYEIAARHAWAAGRGELVDELLAFGEVEWDHEAVLRACAAGHLLWRVFPHWETPAPRETIRERFAAFLEHRRRAAAAGQTMTEAIS